MVGCNSTRRYKKEQDLWASKAIPLWTGELEALGTARWSCLWERGAGLEVRGAHRLGEPALGMEQRREEIRDWALANQALLPGSQQRKLRPSLWIWNLDFLLMIYTWLGSPEKLISLLFGMRSQCRKAAQLSNSTHLHLTDRLVGSRARGGLCCFTTRHPPSDTDALSAEAVLRVSVSSGPTTRPSDSRGVQVQQVAVEKRRC